MGLRSYLKKLSRRPLTEPSHCRECEAMSFTGTKLDGCYPRWVCDECKHVHGVSFAGTWVVRSPDESRVDVENL